MSCHWLKVGDGSASQVCAPHICHNIGLLVNCRGCALGPSPSSTPGSPGGSAGPSCQFIWPSRWLPTTCSCAAEQACTAEWAASGEPLLHPGATTHSCSATRPIQAQPYQGDNCCECNMQEDYEVMVTSGANQAFANLVVSLLDAGDRCVLWAPYYFNHLMALQMTGDATSKGDDSSPILLVCYGIHEVCLSVVPSTMTAAGMCRCLPMPA